MKRTLAGVAVVLGLVGFLAVMAAEHPPHHKARAVMADATSPPTQAPTTTTSTTTVPTTTVPPTTTPPTTTAPVRTSVLARRTVRVQSAAPAVPVATAPREGDLTFPPECLSSSYWASFQQTSEKIGPAHHCWDALLAQYAWNTSTAFSVMMCESEGNPNETNSSGATGLMQVITNGASTEPNRNMRQAWAKYTGAGNSWSPWSPSSYCSSRKQKG